MALDDTEGQGWPNRAADVAEQDCYYTRQGERRGPIARSRLLEMRRSGELAADDWVWWQGLADWQTVALSLPALQSVDAAPSAAAVAVGFAKLKPAVPPPRRPWRFHLAVISWAVLCFLGAIELFARSEQSPRPWGWLAASFGLTGLLTLALAIAGLWALRRIRLPVSRMVSLLYVLVAGVLMAELGLHAPSLLRVAAASGKLAGFVIATDPQADWISYTGSIGPGSAFQLRTTLQAHPQISTLVVDSPGGLLDQAFDMAEMIEQRQLQVVIREQCDSACVLLLMAAKVRFAEAGAQLGLHSPSAIANLSPIYRLGVQDQAKQYFEFLANHGLPKRYLELARRTAPTSVSLVSATELVDAGVVRSVIATGARISPVGASGDAAEIKK